MPLEALFPALRTILDGALAVGLAPACAACGTPLDSPLGGPVCAACWEGIAPQPVRLCAGCGGVRISWRQGDGSCCDACRGQPAAISRSAALGEYDGRLRDVLHALKYGGRRTTARRLAAMMRERCGDVLAGADAVVPVPLHWRRRWSRGFNQAAELSQGLHLPVLHALRRRRRTRPQTELPAGARQANVAGAFALRRAARVQGLCLVVVDDVRTTGATLDACARTLLAGGAAEVRALTAAAVATRQSAGPRPTRRPGTGRR